MHEGILQIVMLMYVATQLFNAFPVDFYDYLKSQIHCSYLILFTSFSYLLRLIWAGRVGVALLAKHLRLEEFVAVKLPFCTPRPKTLTIFKQYLNLFTFVLPFVDMVFQKKVSFLH